MKVIYTKIIAICRNSVVIARENVLKLNQEALEVDKKLSSKMQIHFQGISSTSFTNWAISSNIVYVIKHFSSLIYQIMKGKLSRKLSLMYVKNVITILKKIVIVAVAVVVTMAASPRDVVSKDKLKRRCQRNMKSYSGASLS